MKQMNLKGGKQTTPGADIVGIDLGTTNCAVAVYSADLVPTLLPIGENGKYTVPSCVKWEDPEMNGCKAWTVGAEAYAERFMPDVVYSIKRLMGSGKTVRFTDRHNPDHFIDMTPAEVSAQILGYLKRQVAEFYKPVDSCVITVPAYFNQRQIEDTLEAAKLAGWDCKQILKEPTSASYIYSQLGYAGNGSVLIYDLGGGTFDVTHMNFLRRDSIPSKLLTSLKRQYGIDINASKADVNDQYFCRVLGTYGDVHLGGDDIDKAFGDRLMHSQNIALSDEGKERLYLKCEEFKKLGVYGMDVEIEGQTIKLAVADLNYAVDQIFEKTMDLIKDIDMSDIKTIVLVGGSTQSQRIRDNLASAFPGVEISAVLDPDATVALGAGSVAKALSSNKGLMYSDVLPLPIGILVNEREVEVCIARNTSMPYTAKKTYRTIHDNQERITLHLYQGLSSEPRKCTYLGRLTMEGIPKAPAGDIEVEVSFILTGQGTLRIRSHVDGLDREEELVIDNIFDVSDGAMEKPVEPEGGPNADGDVIKPEDDFEEIFMPLAQGNEDVLAMFLSRRNIKEADLAEGDRQAELQKCEDDIVERITAS